MRSTADVQREQMFVENVRCVMESQGARGILFDEPRLEQLIKEIKEAKAKKSGEKSQKDYRRLAAYDIIEADGKEFVIKKNRNAADALLYYISIESMFDILEKCHVELGHKRTLIMFKNLSTKYANITRDVVDIFNKLCQQCHTIKKSHSKIDQCQVNNSSIPNDSHTDELPAEIDSQVWLTTIKTEPDTDTELSINASTDFGLVEEEEPSMSNENTVMSMQLLSQVRQASIKDLEEAQRVANNRRLNAWIECSLCDVTAEDRVELRDHHRLSHNFNFFCKVPGCLDMFQTESALMKHFQKSHNGKYHCIQCTVCPFWTYREILFSKHNKKHSMNVVHCEGCDKTFYNKEDCKLHASNDHDTESTCVHCSEKINFAALKEHKNAPACPSCKAKFACEKLLIRHIKKCSAFVAPEKKSAGCQTTEETTFEQQPTSQNITRLSSVVDQMVIELSMNEALSVPEVTVGASEAAAPVAKNSAAESQAPSRSRTAVPNAANLVEKISLEDDNDISASVYMLNEMDDSVSQNSASQDVLESSDGDDDDDDNVDREDLDDDEEWLPDGIVQPELNETDDLEAPQLPIQDPVYSTEDLNNLNLLDAGRKMDRRTLNKLRRCAGMDYVSRKKNKDGTSERVTKSARTMLPPCDKTRRCHTSKEYHCSSFTEQQRQKIFDSIWGSFSNWETKRAIVLNLVQRRPRQRQHQAHAMNKYFLPNANGTSKVRVCAIMFCSTVGFPESSIKRWYSKLHMQEQPQEACTVSAAFKLHETKERREILRAYLSSLAKETGEQPTGKKWKSLSQIWRQYCKEVESPVSKSTFVKTAQALKLSVDDLIKV